MSDSETESVAEEPQPVEPFVPGAPFDDSTADIILRSSDDVDFKVHKTILTLASPVFRDMFQFPQDSQGSTEIPVLKIVEECHVLDWILRASYPTPIPDLNDLDFIYRIMQVADKYQMDFIENRVVQSLHKFLESNPLRVYAIACRFKQSSLAAKAARHTLHFTPESILQADIPEFKSMPVYKLQCLLRYRQQCVDAAVSLTRDLDWMRPWMKDYQACWWKDHIGSANSKVIQCKQSTKEVLHRIDTVDGTYILHQIYPQQWFVDRLEEIAESLRKNPIGSAVAWKKIPKSTQECPLCGPACLTDLMAFAKVLSKKVDEVTAQVGLNLNLFP